ncbi:ABC transporter permease [Isobaculum melis]|uniref:ABC-type transport system, involved in lipoprotein release, permease component n=1 Tax=Isobaculum melis TaxID=142588 RepID=A0A1H9Q5I6_9LACT|nr:ABC transporter permease [Isobaculum melis]SER55826.1 ABC-type transport system, involved in lipoprotein release, permease component [Isobaculum melis]
MNILVKKMLRDFRKMKGEFISILLLAFLGMLVFTGFISAWKSMDETFEAWSESSHLADAWISGNQIPDTAIENIKKEDTIQELQKQSTSTMVVDKKDGNQLVQAVVTDEQTISTLKNVSGEAFDATKKGVWVDDYFATENAYQIGDQLTLWLDGQQFDTVILGTILSPDFIAYKGPNHDLTMNHQKYGYVYTNNQTIPLKQLVGTNQLLVKLSDTEPSAELKQRIEEALGEHFMAYQTRINNPNVATYIQKVLVLKKLAILFSAVIMLLVLLTILTTIQRLVRQQRTIIATLKALGIRNRSILFHYSSYGLFISLIGVILGMIVAPYSFTPFVLATQRNQFMLANWQEEFPPIIFIVGMLIVVLSTLTAYLASRKSVQSLPAEMLRIKIKDHQFSEKGKWTDALFKQTSFAWKWVTRDALRNKKKQLIAMLTVAGSILLLIISFGIQYSIQQMNQQLYGKQFDYRFSIQFAQQVSNEQRASVQQAVGDEGQWQETRQGQLRLANRSENVTLVIMDQGLYTHFYNQEKQPIQLKKEGIVLSHFLAQKWQVEIGDTLQFKPTGTAQYLTTFVTDIAYVSAPQGILMSREAWQQLDQPFMPNTLLTGRDISQQEIATKPGVHKITSLKKQKEDAAKVAENMQSIIITYGFFAVILSVVVLYNLGVLNFTERYREYATLKVLGFRKKEIRGIILRDQWLAFLLGGALSLVLIKPVLTLFGTIISTDESEIFTAISLERIFISFSLILICSLLVGVYINRKVQKIEMTEALKNVD